ncbi:MAG: hypothetical protein JXD21_03240 [Candidatus Omnitrophica bacterium]|nr:hypothetical protein [Candidatus Omnitrophota bacterium]
MEVKLDTLIEKIKQEGVAAGENQAKKILTEAKAQAQKLKDEAQAQATHIRQEAQKEAEQFRHNAESALAQAARDTVLMVREQLCALSEQLLKRALSAQLSPDFLKELLIHIIQKWSPEGESSLDILVSEEDKGRLEELLFTALGDAARQGIEIKASTLIQHGFRIGSRDDQTYYDFTDEGITETLKTLVTPKVAQLISGPSQQT